MILQPVKLRIRVEMIRLKTNISQSVQFSYHNNNNCPIEIRFDDGSRLHMGTVHIYTGRGFLAETVLDVK